MSTNPISEFTKLLHKAASEIGSKRRPDLKFYVALERPEVHRWALEVFYGSEHTSYLGPVAWARVVYNKDDTWCLSFNPSGWKHETVALDDYDKLVEMMSRAFLRVFGSEN